MAFSQIVAVANRTNAAGQSPAVAVPANLHTFTVRVDTGTPQNFTNPATQSLLLIGQFSFDGGVTFQDVAGGTVFGSATSTWHKGSPNPFIAGGVPTDPSYPTHARGRYAQTGTFRFGLSIEVL